MLAIGTNISKDSAPAKPAFVQIFQNGITVNTALKGAIIKKRRVIIIGNCKGDPSMVFLRIFYSNVTHDPLGNQTLPSKSGVVQVGSMSWFALIYWLEF